MTIQLHFQEVTFTQNAPKKLIAPKVCCGIVTSCIKRMHAWDVSTRVIGLKESLMSMQGWQEW